MTNARVGMLKKALAEPIFNTPPVQRKWVQEAGGIMPAPPPPPNWLGANAALPTFTTSNTTSANYYNAATTASGAQ